MWTLAEENEAKAMQLKPDLEAARANLDWIHSEMRVNREAPALVADDLLQESALLMKNEQFEESLAAAQSALRFVRTIPRSTMPSRARTALSTAGMKRWTPQRQRCA